MEAREVGRTVAEVRSKSDEIIALARDLLDDVELSRLPPEGLVLKATRLARLVEHNRTLQWLRKELGGYSAGDPLLFESGRVWTIGTLRLEHCESLAQLEGTVVAMKARLAMLRIPDISASVSSSNPNEWVAPGAPKPEKVISDVVQQSRLAEDLLTRAISIRGRVLSRVHAFAVRIYQERAFSGLAATIFERYQDSVHSRLASLDPETLQKVPHIFDRLGEGAQEAVSQALTTCRRLIDSVADLLHPPAAAEVWDGNDVQLGPEHKKNRLLAYVRQRTSAGSRRDRLRRSLFDIYVGVSKGVHSDVAPDEARALLLGTYLLLGEIFGLPQPAPEPPPAPASRVPAPAADDEGPPP